MLTYLRHTLSDAFNSEHERHDETRVGGVFANLVTAMLIGYAQT